MRSLPNTEELLPGEYILVHIVPQDDYSRHCLHFNTYEGNFFIRSDQLEDAGIFQALVNSKFLLRKVRFLLDLKSSAVYGLELLPEPGLLNSISKTGGWRSSGNVH